MSSDQILSPSWRHRETGITLSNTFSARYDSWRLLSLACALLLALTVRPVEGGVKKNNGNYYITYNDIALSLPCCIYLARTYNSKSDFQGIFGYGWGSQVETYLDVQGDGTIIMHENGGGGLTRFRPPVLSLAEIQAAVDRIIKADRRDGRFRDDTDRRERRAKLLQDAEVRSYSWSRYVKMGLLEPQHISPGTLYRSSKRGQQRLLRTHDGFQRITQGRTFQEFDGRGRLVVIRELDCDDAVFHLVRNLKGHISRIVDQKGQQWRFHMNDNGTVARIDAPEGKSSIYHYDSRHLIGSVDLVGNRYSYRYDRRGNLNAIGYTDGGRVVITYTGTEYYGLGLVRSVTAPDRTTTWYDYGDIYNRPNGRAYFTKVTRLNPDGNTTPIELYEYWIDVHPDGTTYTKRERCTRNDDEVLYDVKYKNQQQVSRAEFDNKVMSVTYNDLGQFETISVEGLGAIKITYNADGKIQIQEVPDIDSRKHHNKIIQELQQIGRLWKKDLCDCGDIALLWKELESAKLK